VLAACLAGAAFVALIAVGYVDQRKFIAHRYATFDPALTWVHRYAPANHRIGLAGEWPNKFFSPPFAVLGPRLRDEVSFIGPVRSGIMSQYTRAQDFQRAVQRDGYDLVLVQDVPKHGVSPEERWLRPLGFSPVASSPVLVLLRRARVPG
jgi:hypothetical protein